MIGLPFEFPEIMNCELKVLSLISELFTPEDTGISFAGKVNEEKKIC